MATLKEFLGLAQKHGGDTAKALGVFADVLDDHVAGLSELAQGARSISRGVESLANAAGKTRKRLPAEKATSGAVVVSAKVVAPTAPTAPAAPKRRRKVETTTYGTTVEKAIVVHRGEPDAEAWKRNIPRNGNGGNR